MKTSHDQVRTAVAQQAGEWYLANQEGPQGPAERAAFAAWLRASPLHVEEYLGVALVARDLRVAADDPLFDLDWLLEPARTDAASNVVWYENDAATPQVRAERRAAPQAWLRAVTATAAVLVAAAAWWALDTGPVDKPVKYETARGEQAGYRLPDGSSVYLNTESSVTVRYGRRERVVELDRGQALFTVAHDEQRRFRVAAGAAGVIAVGTRFAIYRQPSRITITVADGRVAVFAGDPPRTTDWSGPVQGVRFLDAGYELHVDGGVLSDHPIASDQTQALAWLKGKIAFQHEPLGEVAEEFNRYGRVRLEVEGATLRDLPVSGVFDAGDIESFVAFLDTVDGVVVERSPTRIRVFSSTAASPLQKPPGN